MPTYQSLYHPGTNIPVTHSFEERILSAEFDDALVDQKAWKNVRYDGSRLKAKEINFFTETSSVWPGDESYQELSVIQNETTAIYIANSVVGGTEDPQLATLRNHSYVGIHKIVLVNINDDSVQVLDKTSEPFDEFHRFITNDFPTGNQAKLKVLDPGVSVQLKSTPYRVKMNKGNLLKTFEFKSAGEYSGSGSPHTGKVLVDNNSMYLYKGGTHKDNYYHTGSLNASPPTITQPTDQLRFRFATFEIFEGTSASLGGTFDISKAGPSFASSSIIENKFTQQYYVGDYGFIKHQPQGTTTTQILGTSGLGSASRFIALDTLDFLRVNNENTTLTNQEKTELHITFFEGTKDFSKSYMPLDVNGINTPSSSIFGGKLNDYNSSVSKFDERSIGTFEIDQNRAALDVEQGDECNAGLPVTHELIFKGKDDTRFLPRLSTFVETLQNAHVVSTASSGVGGCVGPNEKKPPGTTNTLQSGLTIDRLENFQYIVQGGALGQVGYFSAQSASSGLYGIALDGSTDASVRLMNVDNYYSGSFRYDISFLEKDHTLIMDVDKDTDLPNGIGNLGVAIIPEHLHDQVEFNLDYYLEKAGIITTSPGGTTNIVASP